MAGFRAFLLAAGLGTRLRPLTLVRPKPMLPVGGVVMLDHALTLLARHGFAPSDVLVNAHHLWPQVAGWAHGRGCGLQVELPEVLGTGGALRAARERMAEAFVVLNGDILCDVDLSSLLEAVPPGGAAMALMVDARMSAVAPVDADAQGVVTRMRDFAGAPGRGRSGTFFTGVHACSRDLLDAVPEGAACILRTAYRSVLDRGLVRGVTHRGAWVDIGAPAEYLAANLARAGHGLIAPTAVVGGRAVGSVVGAGAVVPVGASVEACVVWDGVEVPPGDHHHAVVWGRSGEVGSVLTVGATSAVRGATSAGP